MFEGMIIMGLYIIALVNLDKINGENAKYKHGVELHHAQIADGRVRRRKSKLLEEEAIRRALETDA